MQQSLTPFLRAATILALFGIFTLWAADNSPAPAARNEPGRPNEQFAPYEYLIGEWDVKVDDDGPVAAIIRVKWGPNHAYLWYSSSLLLLNVHRTPLARLASDHFPLVCELTLN